MEQDTIQVSVVLTYADYLKAHALTHSEHRATLSSILSGLLHEALEARDSGDQDQGLPGLGR